MKAITARLTVKRVASLAPGLPALRGGTLALLAAALFGVSTPLVQRFGVGLGAFSTAALLYAGAAAVGVLSRQRIDREAGLQRADLPRLIEMAGFGAVVGPVALAWGLQHTSGTSASLMLTLEALFTAVLAWRLYRETLDGRVWTAMALLLAGVVLHLAESHGHEHAHEALEHEHAHRHDDGHHDHPHDAMPAAEHSHVHRHPPLRHQHPHVPDAHHGHRH